MITLRPYQNNIVNKVKDHIRKGESRILVNAPTGSGKTVMFSRIAQGAVAKGNKILVVSHRIELLTQANGTFANFGLSPELITAKSKLPPTGDVFCGMTNSLKNRMEKPEWKTWFDTIDIIIIDECHRSEFNWVLKHESGKLKLGFTATAKRTNKMPQLSSEYDVMVEEVDVQELIKLGYLLPDKYFGVPVDISKIKKDHNGEFNNSQLHERFAKKRVFRGLADNLKKIAPDEQSICFCVNIRHCIETTLALNEAGISAKFITSKVTKPKSTSKGEDKGTDKKKLENYEFYNAHYQEFSGDRDTIVDQWKNRDFDVLVNAGIFVEGFDEPKMTCVIINMATTSVNKWLQMVGRGARPYDAKKFFKILDFGGNADRLGHYRAERSFSLTHKTGEGNGVVPVKTCKKCESLCLVSARICKYCGNEFPTEKEEREIQLIEQKWDNPNELKAAIEGRTKAWVWRQIFNKEGREGLMRYAVKKGYSRYWVERMVQIYGLKKARNGSRKRSMGTGKRV